MESVPGAVATGLTLASGNDAATNDRFRTRLRLYPVATAPGTDLIPKLRHYRTEIQIDGMMHERLEFQVRRRDLPDGGRAPQAPRAARNNPAREYNERNFLFARQSLRN
jgi:hypothetical protein